MSEIKVTVKFVPLKRTPRQQEAERKMCRWLYEMAMEQMEKNLAAQSEEIKTRNPHLEN